MLLKLICYQSPKFMSSILHSRNYVQIVSKVYTRFQPSLNQKSSIICQHIRFTTTIKFGQYADIPDNGRKIVGWWLAAFSGSIFGAVMLGGITRLTESGLSMTSWKLLGEKYPKNHDEWIKEFEIYKSFPEYKYLNKERGLTLQQFKMIYSMEYGHRMWGRFIGIFFVVPSLFFLKKGWITKKLKPRLLIFGSLLFFQGLLGWYMVKSGLNDDFENKNIPRVSQYRLATHLGTAFILYTLSFWAALSHLLPPQQIDHTCKKIIKLKIMSHGIKSIVFLTAISGAFVAGLDAGLVYNTWPKMGDRWIPDDINSMVPKWKNIFENSTTVQFTHRYLGEFSGALILIAWLMSRKCNLPYRARLATNVLASMALIQISLGITTLLTFVPTHIAALHQSGSLILLSSAVWLTHELRRLPK